MKIVALVLLLGLSSSVAHADERACRDAVEQYNSSLHAISSAMQQYSRCVSDSRGRDDCGREFRELQDAQDKFERAVSASRTDCR